MSGRPLGIGLTVGTDNLPRFFVRPIDRVSDQIWDAVREAINANMTPDQFKAEASAAWVSHLKEDAASAAAEFRRKP